MNDLEALGITLPSPAYIVGLIVFGIVGLVAFVYGKRAGRPRTRWLGLALMLYPYVVSNTWALYLIGIALYAGVWMDGA